MVEVDFSRYALFGKAPRQQLQSHPHCQQIHVQRKTIFRHIILGEDPARQAGIVAFMQNGQQVFVRPDGHGVSGEQTVLFLHNRFDEAAGQFTGAQIQAVPQPKLRTKALVPRHPGVAAAHELHAQGDARKQIHLKIRKRLKKQRLHADDPASVHPYPGDAPAVFRFKKILRTFANGLAQIVLKAAVIHFRQHVYHRIGAKGFVQSGSVTLGFFFFRQGRHGVDGVGALQDHGFLHNEYLIHFLFSARNRVLRQWFLL